MRAIGVFMIFLSVMAFLGAFGMETSVPVSEGRRVQNIGLMRDQQNAVILGCALFVVGGIFVATGRGGATKTCPFCAEKIQRAASVCRYCGKAMPTPEKGDDIVA